MAYAHRPCVLATSIAVVAILCCLQFNVMNTDSKTLSNPVTATAVSAAAEVTDEPHFDINSPSLIKQSIGAEWVMDKLESALANKTPAEVAAVKKTIDDAFVEVSAFDTLEVYKAHRDLTAKTVDPVLKQLKTDLEKALVARRAADPSFKLKALPLLVVTGSVAHGTSYPPPGGDTDYAWVCKSKEEMEALLSLFLETYAIPDAKGGVPVAKPGTVLANAKFLMPSTFRTKLGLPWVPFNLYGMKFDQTLREADVHKQIEALAARGYRLRFKGDAVALLQYVQNQHVLALIKLRLADAVLRAIVEALYAGNKIHLVEKPAKAP